MKKMQWIIGALILTGIVLFILFARIPPLFDTESPHANFITRCLYILILAAGLCLVRILSGPTPADRIAAIDILGVLTVGFCALAAVATQRSWFLDVGIAWALLSFIAALAFAKHLEGKKSDE